MNVSILRFIDPHHKHNITGNLRIVRNSNLWKLLTKSPNFREPMSTDFNKAFAEVTTGSENCIENLASKMKYSVNNFDQCEKIILEEINLEIEKLKENIKPFYKAYTF